MCGYQEHASKAEDGVNVQADVVAKRIQLWIRQGAGDKVKGQVEICLQCQLEETAFKGTGYSPRRTR